MPEIKLNDAFQREVTALKSAGAGLNNTFESGDYDSAELSLITVDAYKERMLKLFRLVRLYSNLVEKDASDIEGLVAQLKAADSSG